MPNISNSVGSKRALIFLAINQPDKIETKLRSSNDIPDESTLLKNATSALENIVISSLKNAINSTSYVRHLRSSKSALPFLYNQTIRKIVDTDTFEADILKSLWLIYSLEDFQNMQYFLQTIYDCISLLANRYHSIIHEYLNTTRSHHQVLYPITSINDNDNDDDDNSMKYYDFYLFLLQALKYEHIKYTTHHLNVTDKKDHTYMDQQLLLQIIIQSTIAYFLSDNIHHPLYFESIKTATQSVIDVCISIFHLIPIHLEDIDEYISNTNNMTTHMTHTSHSTTHYHSTITPKKTRRELLLSYILQLQIVNHIIRYMLITCTKQKMNRHHTTTHSHHPDIQKNTQNSSMPIEHAEYLQEWYIQFAIQLTPYQTMISLAIQIALLLVTIGPRNDIAWTILDSLKQKNNSHHTTSITSLSTTRNPSIDSSSLTTTTATNMINELKELNYYSINRTEAIELLSSQPCGTYLIRPHDTKSELYFLSFVGLPEEGIKHAIIRKEMLTVSVEDPVSTNAPLGIQTQLQPNSLNINQNRSQKSGSTTSVSTRQSTGSERYANPFSTIMNFFSAETSSTTTTNTNTTDTSIKSISTPDRNPSNNNNNNNSNSSTSNINRNAVKKTVTKVVYKCGKIGPADTICDLLKDISAVLPTGLIFDKISYNNSSSGDSTKSEIHEISKNSSIDNNTLENKISSDDVNLPLEKHISHSNDSTTSHHGGTRPKSVSKKNMDEYLHRDYQLHINELMWTQILSLFNPSKTGINNISGDITISNTQIANQSTINLNTASLSTHTTSSSSNIAVNTITQDCHTTPWSSHTTSSPPPLYSHILNHSICPYMDIWKVHKKRRISSVNYTGEHIEEDEEDSDDDGDDNNNTQKITDKYFFSTLLVLGLKEFCNRLVLLYPSWDAYIPYDTLVYDLTKCTPILPRQENTHVLQDRAEINSILLYQVLSGILHVLQDKCRTIQRGKNTLRYSKDGNMLSPNTSGRSINTTTTTTIQGLKSPDKSHMIACSADDTPIILPNILYETILHFLQSIIIQSELVISSKLVILPMAPTVTSRSHTTKYKKMTQRLKVFDNFEQNSTIIGQLFPEDIMYAEALVTLLFDVFPTKYVRYQGRGNTNHTEHRILCIESNDLITGLSTIINHYNNDPMLYMNVLHNDQNTSSIGMKSTTVTTSNTTAHSKVSTNEVLGTNQLSTTTNSRPPIPPSYEAQANTNVTFTSNVKSGSENPTTTTGSNNGGHSSSTTTGTHRNHSTDNDRQNTVGGRGGSNNTTNSHPVRRAISSTFDEKYHQAHHVFDNMLHRVSTSSTLLAQSSQSSSTNLSHHGSHTNLPITSLTSHKVKSLNSISLKDETLLISLLMSVTPYVHNLFYRRNSEKFDSSSHDDNSNTTETTGNPSQTVMGTSVLHTSGRNTPVETLSRAKSMNNISSTSTQKIHESIHGKKTSSSGNVTTLSLLSPAEYLTWLLEIGTLNSIAKTPDSSFQATLLYYRYTDPWEVHVDDMSEGHNKDDYTRYGRNKYVSWGSKTIQNTTAHESYDILLQLLIPKTSIVDSSGISSSGSSSSSKDGIGGNYHPFLESTSRDTSPEKLNSQLNRGDMHVYSRDYYSDIEKYNLYRLHLRQIWKLLKVEQWLISSISEAHCISRLPDSWNNSDTSKDSQDFITISRANSNIYPNPHNMTMKAIHAVSFSHPTTTIVENEDKDSDNTTTTTTTTSVVHSNMTTITTVNTSNNSNISHTSPLFNRPNTTRSQSMYETQPNKTVSITSPNTMSSSNTMLVGATHGVSEDGVWRSISGVKEEDEETYISCLSRHLYRNILFSRVGLPHRFTASLQVDIFGIKEVGNRDNFSSLVNMNTGIEVYAIIRLDRPPIVPISKTFESVLLIHIMNMVSDLVYDNTYVKMYSKVNILRAPLDGSYLSKPHRCELVKSPGGSHGSEYIWRDKVTFKYGFPEELHKYNIYDLSIYNHLSMMTTTSISTSSGSTSNNSTNNNMNLQYINKCAMDDTTTGTPLQEMSKKCVNSTKLLHPPQVLIISIYEKSFFADTKLGDLYLPLSSVTSNRPFRDWVPLSLDTNNTNLTTNSVGSTSNNNNSSTWFVHIQLQLKFPLQMIETVPPSTTAGGTYSSAVSSSTIPRLRSLPTLDTLTLSKETGPIDSPSDLTNTQTTKLIRHMEDAF